MSESPIRILLVEDDPIQVELMRHLLATAGYEVAAVATGASAIDMCELHKPDLVFMDIALTGGMDGVHAAELVRDRAKLPVVFVTGKADDATLERARKAEPYGYLVKPIDPRHLKPTVEMALHKHRMERERERLKDELSQAREEIAALRHLLPRCPECRGVADPAEYADRLKRYRSQHGGPGGGPCPDCGA